MDFAYRIKNIIQFNIKRGKSETISHGKGDSTARAFIGTIITGKGRHTGISRRVTDEITYILLAILHTVTVETIIRTGITTSPALPILTFITLSTKQPIITGSTIGEGLGNTLI
jgi:hypothetical protein